MRIGRLCRPINNVVHRPTLRSNEGATYSNLALCMYSFKSRYCVYYVGPEHAQAQARSAGSGFYYMTQKHEPARAWFWAKPAGQTPSTPTRPGQACNSLSPQCKARARPVPALYRPAPALVCTATNKNISHQMLILHKSWCTYRVYQQRWRMPRRRAAN
jgi:hypothetical protein